MLPATVTAGGGTNSATTAAEKTQTDGVEQQNKTNTNTTTATHTTTNTNHQNGAAAPASSTVGAGATVSPPPTPAAAVTATAPAVGVSSVSTPPLPRVCSQCGRGGAVSRCSKCLSTYYCSSTCQSKDWPRHRSHCHTVRVEPKSKSTANRPTNTHSPNNTTTTPTNAHNHATPNNANVASPTAATRNTGTTAAGANGHPTNISAPSTPSHAHSHGGVSHHPHVGSSISVHGHGHSCSNPACPHHGALNRAANGASGSAAAASAAHTASLPVGSPNLTPVHSQTSYSPVPVSNVSASSRHIYVPPCRPTFRPSFINFPTSSGPPLSCIHGFSTNLLFSPDPVRILYADLVDPRHVLASLVDLHAKMKAWKKKMNASAASSNVAAGADAKGAIPKRIGGKIQLPTPPSLAGKGNPNIGIEFHLNDPNPHVLARSILFLVASYMSSALMNHDLALSTASNFGITLPGHSVYLPNHNNNLNNQPSSVNPASNNTSPTYTPQPSSTNSSGAPVTQRVLSSYQHWSPQDHWAFLFALYGCFSMPITFVRRLRETLELLVRLTGANTIDGERRAAMDAASAAAAAAGANSNAPPSTHQHHSHHHHHHHHPLTQQDATAFSSHPYTFFLHLPSLTLGVLLPIWRAWEDGCLNALEERTDAIAAASASASSSPSSSSSPPLPAFDCSLPAVSSVFTPADLATAHPGHVELQQVLERWYTRGTVKFERRFIPRVKKVHTTATNSNAPSDGDSADAPSSHLTIPVPELTPPSHDEYECLDDFLLNPTLFPINVVHSAFHNPASPLAPSGSTDSSATSAAAAARFSSELDLPWLYATTEPFSKLLTKLSGIDLRKDAATDDMIDPDDPKGYTKKYGVHILPACMDLMSKMSHALFWVVGFQQGQLVPHGMNPAAAAAAMANNSNGSPTHAMQHQQQQHQQSLTKQKVPYVRLYFYNHDLYFHLHTYDFLYDRILVYHLPEFVGMQSLILLARHRMKNQDSLLEGMMNIPTCWKMMIQQNQNTNSIKKELDHTSIRNANFTIDLNQFCLLSLNANLKLLRNIFGWDLQLYTYPTSTIVLRFTVCDYNLDLTAPGPYSHQDEVVAAAAAADSSNDTWTGDGVTHTTDGFRIIQDWLLTTIQPLMLHEELLASIKTSDEYGTIDGVPPLPRATCNLRTFCLLIGLLIKQGHLDQVDSRRRMVQLFATLLQPHSPWRMDHLFTSLITHIGLLKAELLPLMYLLLSPIVAAPSLLTHDTNVDEQSLESFTPPGSIPPQEDDSDILAHNVLFFKGLWQLELVSMKFEVLVHAAWEEQLKATRQMRAKIRSNGNNQQPVESNSGENDTVNFSSSCRLCALAGPLHAHHSSHGHMPLTIGSKDALLSMMFVTAPESCPPPPGSAAAAAQAANPNAPNPLAWVHLRGTELQSFLRRTGRAVQVIDVVDLDWSTGIVTAWCNRTYVNYVRKCSSFAQVCIIDFEEMRVLAPPRSVVHLKALRSMNIR